MAQITLAPEVRGVLIPLTDASALLPNACVSEVITYGVPQPVEGAPDWVLGIVTWRGWRMPLFSFSKLCGRAEQEETSGAKVAILKAFGGIHKMPYMALLAQGFPKLTNVTADRLLLQGDQESLPDGVLYRVTVEEDEALIPDLNSIERELLKLIEPGTARAREGDEEAPDEDVAASEPEAQDTEPTVEHGDTASGDEIDESATVDEWGLDEGHDEPESDELQEASSGVDDFEIDESAGEDEDFEVEPVDETSDEATTDGGDEYDDFDAYFDADLEAGDHEADEMDEGDEIEDIELASDEFDEAGAADGEQESEEPDQDEDPDQERP